MAPTGNKLHRSTTNRVRCLRRLRRVARLESNHFPHTLRRRFDPLRRFPRDTGLSHSLAGDAQGLTASIRNAAHPPLGQQDNWVGWMGIPNS